MELEKKYVKCRFLGADGQPKGREYTYSCAATVAAGDYVYTLSTDGETKLLVTEIDVPEETVAAFIYKVKPVYTTPAGIKA